MSEFVRGQVGAGGNGSRRYQASDTVTFNRILTCSCALVKMGTCNKETDRVQDPQNTEEAVKTGSVGKKSRPV